MNQTGLRESMAPSLNSRLFDKEPMTDLLIQSTFKEITQSPNLLTQYKAPIVFDIMPLIENPEIITVSKDQMIPSCSNCHAYPNQFTRLTDTKWKCSICNTQNERKPNHIFPSLKYYQIVIEPGEIKKPLFLFIIQETDFFLSSKENLGNTLENWCKQNPNANVCFFTIGRNITTFDLKKSIAHVLIDSDDFDIQVTEAKDANFSFCLKGITATTNSIENHFLQHLSIILSRFDNNELDLNIVLLANQFEHEEKYREVITNFLKVTSRRCLHLFTTNDTENVLWLIQMCYSVKLFEPKEASLVVPVLKNWLSSGFLFKTKISFFCNPNSFSDHFITTRYSSNGNTCWIPFIDGESSFSIETNLKKGCSGNAVFQVFLQSLLNNGLNSIRIITFHLQQTHKITEFDGICLGVYLAREVAVNLELDKQQEAYNDHFERCVEMVSAWSSKGIYYRKIESIFKDAPVLMNAVMKSPLFSHNKVEAIAAKINFLTMSLTRVCRSIYPTLILPPLKFPHRLAKENLTGFKSALVIWATKG